MARERIQTSTPRSSSFAGRHTTLPRTARHLEQTMFGLLDLWDFTSAGETQRTTNKVAILKRWMSRARGCVCLGMRKMRRNPFPPPFRLRFQPNDCSYDRGKTRPTHTDNPAHTYRRHTQQHPEDTRRKTETVGTQAYRNAATSQPVPRVTGPEKTTSMKKGGTHSR